MRNTSLDCVDGSVDVQNGYPDYDCGYDFDIVEWNVNYGIHLRCGHGYGFSNGVYVSESLNLGSVDVVPVTDFVRVGAYVGGKIYEIS